MISVLIQATLHSLTILVDLPTFHHNVIEREFLAPLPLFAVPRLTLLKDRFQPRATRRRGRGRANTETDFASLC